MVSNLHKKYTAVREKCFMYISNHVNGTLTPSKIPQRVVAKEIKLPVILVTPKYNKRLSESPCMLPTPTPTKLRSNCKNLREQLHQQVSPQRQPLLKKPKRCLFQQGM